MYKLITKEKLTSNYIHIYYNDMNVEACSIAELPATLLKK